MGERIVFDQLCRNRVTVGRVSVFGLRWCGWCWMEWLDGLVQGLRGWGSVMLSRRIPAHLRYTQYSILLHLTDIGFLTCIYEE